MVIHDRLYPFDETQERDPADRAVVDKICQYAEERGGTVLEFDGTEGGPVKVNFVFGWEGRYVVYFRCMGSFEADDDYGCEIEIAPPDTLKELHHLQIVWTICYSGDLDWLGELRGLESVNIGVSPGITERFPASWASASTMKKLILGYSVDSVGYLPTSVKSLEELHVITIWTRHSQPPKKPIILPD